MIRIAICDDEAPTRACLASLIRAQGCPCEVVEYASAGDCLADHREIDLLFLDIELNAAGPNGMALARQLREGNSAVQPVIIFVTGYERYVRRNLHGFLPARQHRLRLSGKSRGVF